MFFGKNRREEEWKQAVKDLETVLEEIKGDISQIMGQNQDRDKDMGAWLDSAREAVGRVDKLEERQKEMERQIRRQSDSFEDLLEELQNEQDQEKEHREERREHLKKEQALIALLMCCREQMELVEKQIQKDDSMEGEKLAAWHQQFDAMARERQRLMRPCGLEETGQEGEAVDHEIHEVISVEETEDTGKAGTVAQVYSRGFLQGGHVIKKARVAAYRQATSPESTGI